MRECILAHGGEIHFETLFTDFANRSTPLILGIGHSAHDTYRLLDSLGITLESKGFAMGVRVEHPQELINRLGYVVLNTRGNGGEALESKTSITLNGGYLLFDHL